MKVNKSVVVLQRVLFSLFFLFVTCQAAAALEVAGVKVPEKISIGESGSQLILNGAGVRIKFFIKAYVGAFYLPEKLNTVDAILGDPGPKRISIHSLLKMSDKKLVKTWNEGFAKNNSPAILKSLQDRINQFNTLFSTVRKGDVIRFDHDG